MSQAICQGSSLEMQSLHDWQQIVERAKGERKRKRKRDEIQCVVAVIVIV